MTMTKIPALKKNRYIWSWSSESTYSTSSFWHALYFVMVWAPFGAVWQHLEERPRANSSMFGELVVQMEINNSVHGNGSLPSARVVEDWSFSPALQKDLGHPQACVYPYVCLEIDNVSGKAPLPGQGVGRYTESLPCSPFRVLGAKSKGKEISCLGGGVLGRGLYQIQCQSLNTHGNKHRSGCAQRARHHINQSTIDHVGGLPGRVG